MESNVVCGSIMLPFEPVVWLTPRGALGVSNMLTAHCTNCLYTLPS